jgi:GTP cyclohydrolase I
MKLADVQASTDSRQLAIDEAGIAGIRYPVNVWDRQTGKQQTVAEVSMSVDVKPEVKGAHLSRFVEVLHDSAAELTPDSVPEVLRTLADRLGSERAVIDISSPTFSAVPLR